MGPMESLEVKEDDGEIKAPIQAQMADMQEEKTGEKRLSKALDVETHEDYRMNESEEEKGFIWLE